jgi:hypothetical protein
MFVKPIFLTLPWLSAGLVKESGGKPQSTSIVRIRKSDQEMPFKVRGKTT